MRNRKCILIVILFVAQCAWAQEKGLKQLLTLRFDNESLPRIFSEIEKQSGTFFFYRPEDLDSVVVSYHGEPMILTELIDKLLEGTNLHFAVDPYGNIFVTRTTITGSVAQGFYSSERTSTVAPTNETRKEQPTIVARDIAIGKKIYEIGKKGSNTSSTSVTLSGFIRTGDGVAMDGASVQVEKLKRGTVTNSRGYYTITLPPGTHELLIRSVGMQDARRMIRLLGNGSLDIEMLEDVTKLEEVVIQEDEASSVKRVRMGVEKLSIAEIRTVPTVFGEGDVLRVVLTLPGVKSVGEASAGFNVRGGAADQNLILYNDATIYNPSHFFGFFSAFNPETVKEVELFKSLMPARYGGRLSSVMQVTGKTGNNEKIKGSAGIGLLTSRINLEGPLVKDKTTFVAGARTTYSNWLFNLLPRSSGFKNTEASFYDFNLNLNHRMGSKDALALTGYLSNDKSNLNTDTTYYYTNKNLSLKWLHEFNSNWTGAITVGHDHYSYSNKFDSDSTHAYKMKFGLDQEVAKVSFIFAPNNKHTLEFGLNGTFYKIKPGEFTANHPFSLVIPVTVATEQAIESALYIEEQFKLNKTLSLTAGLRYSVFNYLGPQSIRIYPSSVPRTVETTIDTVSYQKGKVIQTYHGLDYRLSGRYAITESFSVKAGYSTSRQFIHMLSNTVAISPTDTWKLSDNNIKPQQSQQISFGVFKNLFSNVLELSLEGYTKKIKNYLDYKSGANLLVNPHIETEVFTTAGKAYGIEMMARKPKGNFNGWVSYTYSRTLLRLDDPNAGEEINKGRYYPASYDKPHDFTFVGNQKLSRRFSLSMNLTYSSGRPVTIPVGTFRYGGAEKTLYSDRNGYRIPDYFRTDISLNVEGNHKVRQLTHNSWTFGVYNLTGRKNPYSVYFIAQDGVVKGYKLSIFGTAIPFINYNIRF